jgi:acetyltransferase-like isoleucine patch superfamily enzyme
MDSTEQILHTSAEPDQECALAMSPQQKRFSAQGLLRLKAYKDFVVGDKGWGFLFAFEVYSLFVSSCSTLLGIGLRSLLLPMFFKRFGKGTVVGRGVAIRQPHLISLGRSVIVDDGAVLDIRSPLDKNKEAGIEIGDHVLIGRNSIITTKGGQIKLGNACNISTNCRIATRSKIEIGDSVLIAAYVYIGCGNHRFDDPSKPIIEQAMDVRGGVRISSNAWIGAKSTILDGVSIGKNAVIGAHSLVREDVPDNAIVAGTPAKLIRYRT